MAEGHNKPQVEIVVDGASEITEVSPTANGASASAEVSPKIDGTPAAGNEMPEGTVRQKQLQFTIDPTINQTSESGGASVTDLPVTDLEKEPQFDHYRNALSIKREVIPRRPSLKQLHGVEWDQEKELTPLPPQKATVGSEKKKLGWIEGVLIRCVLNIIGVMLYLRISWVAAQAGLLLGSLVLLLSSAIVFLTALSMSAICTNGKIRGGGTYFIISRSLGPDFGGSIGIIFAVANAVSAAVYLAGFADTVLEVMKSHNTYIVDGGVNDIRIIGWITAIFLLAVVCAGLNFESKAQIALLVVLVISLLNYFIGLCMSPTTLQRAQGITGFNGTTLTENSLPDWRGETFASVLAVYFPAATGFLAGANISGDLKEPERAIPKGTIIGVTITSILYLAVLWFTGTTCLRDASGLVEDLNNGMLSACAVNQTCVYGLHNYYHILELEGAWAPLITAGVFSSTLSSALASTVSAPKVLQAVARDRIFPYIGFFAKGSKKSDEPVRGYLLTFAITVGIIAIGDINQIAPLISNFFMASYALINYACFDASFAKSPGFRPAFKFYNMWLSLLGAFTCTVMMFFISWVNALVTVIFIMLLYVYLARRKPDVNWGDSTQANSFRNAVHNMLKLQMTQDHVKTYRPMILLLTGNPCKRKDMVNFVSNITRSQGMLICGQVLQAPLDDNTLHARYQFSRKIIWWLKKRHIRAFYYSYLASSLQEGVLALLQLCGMGKLSPNIMIMGFKHDWETSDYAAVKEYFLIIHSGFDFNKGVGILRLSNIAKAPVEKEPRPFTETCNSEPQQLNTLHLSADMRTSRRSTLSTSQSVESFSIFAQRLWPTESELRKTAGRITESSFERQQGVPTEKQGGTDGSRNRPRHTTSSSSSLSETSAKSQFEIEILDNEEKKKNGILSISKLRRKLEAEKVNNNVRVENFQKRIKKAIIDVWWLYDDGGLSVLIPHLLSQEGYLESAKLRIFTIVKRSEGFDEEQSKLIILLNQLRIKFSKVSVFAEDRIQENQETLRLFHELISKFKVPNKTIGQIEEPAASVLVDDAELTTFRSTTERIMKARNLILTHSKNANLIIVTIPVPRKKALSASLYLAWLELLSRDLPLTFLLRGNQEPVLTFYS
ncbi:solute carrier family 12 [Trichuris trichiura]|uniref:Solute carrier family 12 n=1 Tax=Trichuris trichiura TaxID=36087 RepID=A0A077ZAG4_TRITR|nr:solute carrier family 12 [Trichuris trichiura]